MRTRYTRWDGTQTVRLTADRVFDEFARRLLESDDLQDAWDRLLRDGFAGEGFEVVGLDELARRVRAERERLQSRYNLDRALDEPARWIETVRERERDALGAGGDPGGRARSFLERLPASPDEALERLEHFECVDPGAREVLSGALTRRDDVAVVTRFVARHGAEFTGPESVDFDAALELARRMRSLDALERALAEGDLEHVDPAALEDLLGADAARAFAGLADAVAMLTDAGYVLSRGGRQHLSPRGARRLGQLALSEIYDLVSFDRDGGHRSRRIGDGTVDCDHHRPFRFGDAAHLDVAATVRQAAYRGEAPPLRLRPEDLRVRESERETRCATVLLLDMSWSMSWEGRFAAAKKVALAMDSMMRSRYPRDFFGIVGFYTRAVELSLRDLPEVTWNMGDPFTNLQDGLRKASQMLARHPAATRQILVITDGQPTAYFSDGRLFCEWPMSIGGLSTRATVETLREVRAVTSKGIVINTFMLDDSPPLRSFVERMTRMNRGRAFYTTPDELGRFLLVDYVGHRRKVV